MLVAQDVEVRTPGGVRILGPVSLQVAPGQMVALMGTSGSGKSTLVRVLAGVAEPTAGHATWAGAQTIAAGHALGYVPQHETIHDRLTTREALGYAAELRLPPGDVIAPRVDAVMGELGLTQQADTMIRRLSGGERRRAACGLELVGDTHVLLLDEPTSGLDAVLERRLMELFRRLADRGRAVLVVTHATASLDLCDEIIVLEKGIQAHRGGPAATMTHLAAIAHSSRQGAVAPAPVPSATPVAPPMPAPAAPLPTPELPPPVLRPFGMELRVIAGRYLRTLRRDRRTLSLLLGQAPVIGFLIVIVFHPQALSAGGSPTDAVEIVFMLMTGSIWLGVASACREVVKERGLVEREFDVGVRLDAYLLAKALVLFMVVFGQVALLLIVVLLLQPFHVDAGHTLQIFVLAIFTGWTSVATGLAVSCVARSVDQAAGTVPLLLMPQLLFAGALIPLAQMPGVVRGIATIAYARWSYAGIGTAAGIQGRLNAYGGSSVLGFNSSFFTLKFGIAAGILFVFTILQLLLGIYFLRIRPSPDAE